MMVAVILVLVIVVVCGSGKRLREQRGAEQDGEVLAESHSGLLCPLFGRRSGAITTEAM